MAANSQVFCFMKHLLANVKGLTDEQAGKIAEHVQNGNTSEAAEMIRLAMKPATTIGDFWNKFKFARDAGLLSGPPTALTKFFSDNTMQLLRLGERGLASPTEGRYAFNSYLSSLGPMMKVIKEGLLRTTPDLDIAHQERSLHAINPFGTGFWARVVGYPFQAIQAMDTGAKYLAGRVNLAQLAAREGMHRGLGGEALDKFVRQTISAPEDVPNLMESVSKAVNRDTFTSPLQGLSALIANASHSNPFVHIILPFVKVPANIAKEGFLRTPAGFGKIAYDAWRNGLTGDALRDELVKPILGTTIMAGVAALANEGLVSGGGPADKKEYMNKIQTGWQPYSLKAGDKWISYHRLEPVATLLGAAADFVEATKHADKAKAGELVQKALQSVHENLTGKTYLTGMENFFGAIHDPKGLFPSWIKSLETSVVPSVVRRTAQFVDPTIRETHPGSFSPIEAGLPVVSETLPAQETPLGVKEHRELSLPERAVSAFTPFNVSTERPKATVEAELDRLGMAPPAANKVFTAGNFKTHYSDDEYRQLNDIAGRLARPQLESLIQSDDYKGLPDEYKEKYIRDITSHAHAAARMAVREKVLSRVVQEKRGQPPAAVPQPPQP